MAHGSGVISSPTGGGRATGRQREQRNRAAQRRGEAERGGGTGMLPGPADTAQREPCNEGNPAEAPHENDTTDRTVCTVRFFCAVLRYGPKISHRACREFGRIF